LEKPVSEALRLLLIAELKRGNKAIYLLLKTEVKGHTHPKSSPAAGRLRYAVIQQNHCQKEPGFKRLGHSAEVGVAILSSDVGSRPQDARESPSQSKNFSSVVDVPEPAPVKPAREQRGWKIITEKALGESRKIRRASIVETENSA
jgi:hypothetical protein